MAPLPVQEIAATHVLVTTGAARAAHRLTVFDAALHDAGLHDANLVEVSSIVPAGAAVHADVDADEIAASIDPGTFVPTVYAFAASDEPGDEVYAAIAGAWLEDGHGILVEQHGRNTAPEQVRTDCVAMLEEMASVRGTTLTADRWFEMASHQAHEAERWAGTVAAVPYLRSAPE